MTTTAPPPPGERRPVAITAQLAGPTVVHLASGSSVALEPMRMLLSREERDWQDQMRLRSFELAVARGHVRR